MSPPPVPPASDRELARRADEHFCGAMEQIARAMPGGEVGERGPIALAVSGSPIAMFNLAFVRDPLFAPEAQIAEATAHFERRRLPFVMALRAGVDPEAESVMPRMGLSLVATMPSMVLDPLELPPDEYAPRSSGELELRGLSADDYEAFIGLQEEGFGMAGPAARDLFSPGLLSRPNRAFVGAVDGRVVVSGVLVSTGKVAGVYNIATAADARRRGYGGSMTRHVLQAGRVAGCEMGALQSSQMGRAIYTRMGFREVGSYLIYGRGDGPAE